MTKNCVRVFLDWMQYWLFSIFVKQIFFLICILTSNKINLDTFGPARRRNIRYNYNLLCCCCFITLDLDVCIFVVLLCCVLLVFLLFFGAAFWFIDTINGMTIHGMYVRSHVYRLRMEKYTRLHIERSEMKQKQKQKKKKERKKKEEDKKKHTTHTQHGKRDRAYTYIYIYTNIYVSILFYIYVASSMKCIQYNFNRTLTHSLTHKFVGFVLQSIHT